MTIRELERESITGFVQWVADEGVFSGENVLDYGCGRQPYRGLVVDGGGRYHGYDDPGFPASTVREPVGDRSLVQRQWGVILCNQVIQYQPNPQAFMALLYNLLRDDRVNPGRLVITFPTNWPEVEGEDFWRFTAAGMAHLLSFVGFRGVTMTPRALIEIQGDRFHLGHGAIAWK